MQNIIANFSSFLAFLQNGRKIKLILCISIAITVKGFYDRTQSDEYHVHSTTELDGEIEWKIIRWKKVSTRQNLFRVCFIELFNSQNDLEYWQRGILIHVIGGFERSHFTRLERSITAAIDDCFYIASIYRLFPFAERDISFWRWSFDIFSHLQLLLLFHLHHANSVMRRFGRKHVRYF